MKTMTMMLGLAMGALCACGGPEAAGSQEEALTAVVSRAVIVPAKDRCRWPDDTCVPRAPAVRKLEDWKLGTLYWPRDTRASTTIYLQSPTDARRFRAYGIDLQKRAIVFVVEGAKTALPGFRFQVGVELANIVEDSATPDFGLWDGGMTPVFRIPPPPPGPGGNDWLAFKAWNAALDIADAAFNLYSQDVGGFNAPSPTAP